MSERSDFVKGDHVFIKLINLKDEDSTTLSKIFNENLKEALPFATKEFVANQVISTYNPNIDKSLILSPGTRVFISETMYDLSLFENIKNAKYDQFINYIMSGGTFKEFSYINNMKIKTVLIISVTLDGSFYDFLTKKSRDEEEISNALIHISYLYHMLTKNFNMVHGDPKPHNYTWKKLDNPININYDFGGTIIERKNVKHLFYLTDLEFVYSPFRIDVFVSENNYIKVEFDDKYQKNVDLLEDVIYVPMISSKGKYTYNRGLYRGYNENIPPNESKDVRFPRIFTIDLLTLIKGFLTYSTYLSKTPTNLIRKYNMYFTKYQALAKEELDKQKRGHVDYSKVSPVEIALLFES